MTPYQITKGSHVYSLDTNDLIKRANVMWAKLDIKGRVHMVQYVRVTFMTEYEYTVPMAPNMTEYLYTCEPPPRELELVDYDMPWQPYTVADSQLQVAA